MTTKLVTVKADTPIYDATKLLADYEISGMPVVDDSSNLIGILSEWDVLNLLTEQVVDSEMTVEKFMTKDVISFQESDSAIIVSEFFHKSHKRRVPVTNNGKLVGVVSRHDIIKLIIKTRKKVSGT